MATDRVEIARQSYLAVAAGDRLPWVMESVAFARTLPPKKKQ